MAWELCCGGHRHQQLRGRCAALEELLGPGGSDLPPRPLAFAMALQAGLLGKTGKNMKLKIGACARCGSLHIGEASRPGPRAGRPERRDARALLRVRLVED